MLLALALLQLANLIYSYDVILDTNYGKIGGFYYTTEIKTVSQIFLNIPYARPPIGKLRWTKPQEPTNWTDIRNGTQFGYQCVPHVRQAIADPIKYNNISEDCLTLNVMIPTSPKPERGFPILVWIHGGGYQIGSQSLIGYEGFANVYNPHDIIVVTIQYRIGFMGFAASGEDDFLGNYGLWDQTEALKFIHSHAQMWRGDQTRITVLGQSAGAGSTALLTISNHSYPYIRSAIIVSGNAYASWARGANITANSMALAMTLNCPTAPVVVKKCMQSKTKEEIFDAMERMGYLPETVAELMFAPRVDFDFMQENPEQLIMTARPMTIIYGTGNKDMSYFSYLDYSTYIQPFGINSSLWKQFDREEFIRRIKVEVVSNFYKKDREEALHALITHYVDANYTGKKEYDWYLNQYSEMLNDIAMSVPANEEVLLRTRADSEVYLYRFDHYNDAIFPDNLTTELMKGSPHTNEYEYMFEGNFLPNFTTNTWNEKIIKDIVQQSFISLIHLGVPENDLVKWEKATEDNLRFLAISTEPKMLDNYYQDATNFWRSMRKYGYDSITALPTMEINGTFVPISPQKPDDLAAR